MITGHRIYFTRVMHSRLVPVQYRFFSVLIRQYQDGRLNLIASQQGEGFALSDRRLLAALFRIPFMAFKVMAAIHWQALLIWLRGASYFPKPPPPAQKVTQ